MAAFEVTEDAWMARPDSDDLGHAFFGGAQSASNVNPSLFMDVTHAAQNQYNTHQRRDCYESDHDHVRAASNLIDEDDDDANAIRGPSSGTSMGAMPPSQQYTEHASSEAFSQESQSGTARTEEYLSFWSHKMPRQHPPTPVLQRTAAVPEESPSALVDGIVRAGLDTPSRQPNAFSRPMPAGVTPDNASTYSAYSASNTASTHHTMPRDPDSPHSSNQSNPGSNFNPHGASPPHVQYRTVQQHLQMQQQQQQQQQQHGGSPPQAQPQNIGRGGRPVAPISAMPPGPRATEGGPIIILEFKMDRRRRFRCRPELARGITPDQWVVVQLDNGGVDMGTCVEVFTPQDRLAIPKHYGHGECGSVVRLANEADCAIINDVIPEKEENALAKAHQLVHFLHMPFTCIDAEFQFDLKVVNLYYTLTPQAFTSIIPNVSRLQRELGFLLKAKVHLEQLVPVSE